MVYQTKTLHTTPFYRCPGAASNENCYYEIILNCYYLVYIYVNTELRWCESEQFLYLFSPSADFGVVKDVCF